jgi:hypothetical protein
VNDDTTEDMVAANAHWLNPFTTEATEATEVFSSL